MIDGDTEPGTAPYASGGGGTVLEHLYGAVLLSSLLGGDPITELGDDSTPLSVRFQGRRVSPVDDLVVCGSARSEERRGLAPGAPAPRAGPSGATTEPPR